MAHKTSEQDLYPQKISPFAGYLLRFKTISFANITSLMLEKLVVFVDTVIMVVVIVAAFHHLLSLDI